jgi:hypothetical protein
MDILSRLSFPRLNQVSVEKWVQEGSIGWSGSRAENLPRLAMHKNCGTNFHLFPVQVDHLSRLGT